VAEARQCAAIGRHCMVVEEASHDLFQPSPLFGDGPMHAASQFASLLLWRGPTPRLRSSPAMAPRLPGADRRGTGTARPDARSLSFRHDPSRRDVVFDPGRAIARRLTVRHTCCLRLEAIASASAMLKIRVKIRAMTRGWDPDARRFWDRRVHDELHAAQRACHQPRIAGGIDRQNGRQSALDSLPPPEFIGESLSLGVLQDRWSML
jgi:hypothetical protein